MADAYSQFWNRKQLATEAPRFPVVRWWSTDGLSQIETIYFDAVKNAASLLDVGAGDLRIKGKFQAAGFSGLYETVDPGTEHRHTHASLDSVVRKFEAILCLDVIEHLPLSEGIDLLERMTELLAPGGVLIVQTPNARCIRNPLGWDMTHLHCYNARDLWTYLTRLGYSVCGYRIEFLPPRLSPAASIKSFVSKAVIVQLLGCDYADNLGFVALSS
ncbi:MAG: class I SAM-dependent methyltransferase [Candidatus Binatus sp.]